MMFRPVSPVTHALFAALVFAAPAAAQTVPAQEGGLGLYRFPAMHGEVIVFAAEGDLWRVSTAGGVAQRLTTHSAEETDPTISPDGSTLAFTARYEGPAELYTMPIGGGLPVRHTYESETSVATTWTPGGELVYTTTHYATLPVPQLVKLDLDGGTVLQGSPVDGQRSSIRRHRHKAVLCASRLSSKRHQALYRGDRPGHLEVGGRCSGGRGAHG